MKIGNHRICEGAACFVIAEAGVNHNGDMALAHRLIDIAKDAGSDAVKFQTFKAERLVSHRAAKAEYQKQTTDAEESQFDMLRRLELSPAQHVELLSHCAERGIIFLSTPFDEESADFLDGIGVAAFKISSGELTNLRFLRMIAQKQRPGILSTGMGTLEEVGEAGSSISSAGNPPVALLQCTSAYPAQAAESNLRSMATMREAFGVPVGFSDHTSGTAVAIAAAALGAAIIEKHVTIDRTLPGPDHAASLEPDELRSMVAGIRTAVAALGDGIKRPQAGERDIAKVARRSVVAARDLAADTILEPGMLNVLRPGSGIPPKFHDELCGRRLTRSVAAGMPLQWEDLAQG